ncbi:MAG: DUF935 family protein [Pseudomonas sp.]|nr:DUF935 family protein [Pseudomonas sp.]
MSDNNYNRNPQQNARRRPKTASLAQTKSPGKFGKKPPLQDTRGGSAFEIDYFRLYETLYRKEISDWVTARAMRRDPFNPITYPIQQLYKDAMLDNHLQGAIENRILKTLNKDYAIKDTEGNIDTKRSAQIQTRWFRAIVRRALESKFYGYSLMFVSDLELPTREVIDLPRENVIPEKGILVKNSFDPNSEAISFREFPKYFIYVELGGDPIGVLERIAPLTIYKRHSWASWDQFEQIYGLPIRIARTMINTPKHRDDLQSWLETMGTASYAIFDKQVDIELKENKQADAFNVFYQKVRALNYEISKGINGQTMTMDDGSSQSQATVHLAILNEIISADIQDVQDWVSDDLFPILRMHNFDIPEGYYLSVADRDEMDPLEKIKIDEVLLRSGYNLKPEYIEEFYGTPLDESEPRREVAPQLLKGGKGVSGDLSDFFF